MNVVYSYNFFIDKWVSFGEWFGTPVMCLWHGLNTEQVCQTISEITNDFKNLTICKDQTRLTVTPLKPNSLLEWTSSVILSLLLLDYKITFLDSFYCFWKQFALHQVFANEKQDRSKESWLLYQQDTFLCSS